jgi:hypothetical protein
MNKLDELEYKLEGSKWFLPISLICALLMLSVAIGSVYVISVMEENFEQSRPQYDFGNEVYKLESLRG